MNMIEALRRGLDRAGFEADKLMRYNRVKAEALRLNGQVRKQTALLGERALELYEEGGLSDEKISDLAGQIAELRRSVQEKEEEAAAIQAEAWPEPAAGAPAAPPPGDAAPSADVAPAPVAEPSASTAPTFAGAGAPSSAAGSIAAAEATCHNCGMALRPGAMFCSRCGVRVDG